MVKWRRRVQLRALMEEFCSTLTIMNLCQRLFVARFCCNNKSLRGRSFLSDWFTKRKPFASQSLVVQYMHNWRRGRQHKPLRAWPWTDRGQYSQQGRAKVAAHLVRTPCACYMPPAPHTLLALPTQNGLGRQRWETAISSRFAKY